MNDNLFNRIEEKTKVSKDTIISLARKLQDGDYKNENTLRVSYSGARVEKYYQPGVFVSCAIR